MSSEEGENVGIEAIEAEEASIRAANCITPIVAEGTDIDERTIAGVAAARQGQFKRRGNCTCWVVGRP